jgi:hypothetical protein
MRDGEQSMLAAFAQLHGQLLSLLMCYASDACRHNIILPDDPPPQPRAWL